MDGIDRDSWGCNRADLCRNLTDKEILAIRWHMGAYSGEKDWNTLRKVYDSCPEALCVHMADMIATYIMEVE